MSFYAATKRANELMAHAYSPLYGIPVTGLRFFTVYGPKGRRSAVVCRLVPQLLRRLATHFSAFLRKRHARNSLCVGLDSGKKRSR